MWLVLAWRGSKPSRAPAPLSEHWLAALLEGPCLSDPAMRRLSDWPVQAVWRAVETAYQAPLP